MTKFCGKCGAKLDETTGMCPNCDTDKIKQQAEKFTKSVQKREEKIVQQKKEPENKKEARKQCKVDKKAAKKAKKKERRAQLSIGKKICRFFFKLILTVLIFAVLAVGVIRVLIYFDVVNIQFLSDFNQNNLLKIINEKNIIVEEQNIVMTSETEGTATIVVTLPNYELIFENAITAKNPDNYLLKTLILKDYETQEFEMSANVTIENGERVVHSNEVVHKLLEESLINAINALSEVRQ